MLHWAFKATKNPFLIHSEGIFYLCIAFGPRYPLFLLWLAALLHKRMPLLSLMRVSKSTNPFRIEHIIQKSANKKKHPVKDAFSYKILVF